MFHTFEGFQNPDDASPARSSGNERRESSSRRGTTQSACTSCRRRKIKCDGDKPCEACRWYKKVDQCHYPDPRPSRRHVEKLSTTIDEYRSVFEKLFPTTSPDSLVQLPREKLLELLGIPKPESHVQHPMSPATSASFVAHISPTSNDDGSLESLHTMPQESSDDRNPSSSDVVNNVSDDVNALSLSSKRPSSYLGISSIHAILKVIAWLDPGCLAYFSRATPSARQSDVMEYSVNPPCQPQVPNSSLQGPKVTDTQILDAYFTYFQPFVPMLDEQQFRETYRAGCRTDDRWLGLLNIVLALGTIAASTSDDLSHRAFFQRAKSHLSLESFGCSHMETIQTLGLMGGYYLHYTSQPNLAYAMMGAALRMAATLGLHKEFADNKEVPGRGKVSCMDRKRRVWWSLFCMDTWGCMTLGRPSIGRLGPAITVKPPSNRERGNVLDILPLLENVRFCKIATQVQDAMVVAPLIRHSDIIFLDSQLLEWYNNLPAALKDHEPCSESLATARTVMRWRYYNQRMLLYRPTLLSYAMRRIPYIALQPEERTAIERCREIADTTIHDVSANTKQNQMSGWNGVWRLFQAVMVPILGLFLDDDTAGDPRASTGSCQTQIEIAMLTLARMQPWSPTAKRTLDVVSRIFEASKRDPDSANHSLPSTQPAGTGIRPGLPTEQDNGIDEGELPDGFADPILDDAVGDNLWDYLSCSDNSLWPALADFEGTGDLTFGQDKEEHGGLFENMPDPGYFANPSILFC